MELETSLSWLAMTMTPDIAARLSAQLLRELGSPEGVFRASLTGLEACNLPAPAAQVIFQKQNFWRAEKEVAALRAVGAKLVRNAEDVIEEPPTPVRTVLVRAEEVESVQRNLMAEDGLSGSQEKIYELLNVEEPRPIDDVVETSGLNSSEVLATLFDLEMNRMVRQIPGKQFSKILL